MKTIFRLSCSAFIVLSLSAIFVAAQKTREMRTITGNYYDTATKKIDFIFRMFRVFRGQILFLSNSR